MNTKGWIILLLMSIITTCLFMVAIGTVAYAYFLPQPTPVIIEVEKEIIKEIVKGVPVEMEAPYPPPLITEIPIITESPEPEIIETPVPTITPYEVVEIIVEKVEYARTPPVIGDDIKFILIVKNIGNVTFPITYRLLAITDILEKCETNLPYAIESYDSAIVEITCKAGQTSTYGQFKPVEWILLRPPPDNSFIQNGTLPIGSGSEPQYTDKGGVISLQVQGINPPLSSNDYNKLFNYGGSWARNRGYFCDPKTGH